MFAMFASLRQSSQIEFDRRQVGTVRGIPATATAGMTGHRRKLQTFCIFPPTDQSRQDEGAA